MTPPDTDIRISPGQRGWTMIEISIVMVLTAVMSLAVFGILETSEKGARTVSSEGEALTQLRRAANLVTQDIKQTTTSRLVIASLPDGNHTVTLQEPLSITAGVITWGVKEKELGSTAAARTKPGWFLRYTVVDAPMPSGPPEKRLVRQALDTSMKVQKAWILARNILPGTSTPAGFQLTQSGSMWKAQITTRATTGAGISAPRTLSFDIALRN